MEIREATERIVTEREKLYAAAYRAHGAQAMEALADAVKKAAPMYDKLSNKEQFVPLILKNLQADFRMQNKRISRFLQSLKSG